MRPRPTRTALQIARSLVFFDHDRALARILPEGAATTSDALLKAIGHLSPWQARLMARPQLHRWYRQVEKRTTDGLAVHMCLRKRFFDKQTRAALEAGATRVIILGAGLDGLAVRQASAWPTVPFIEIDQPPMAEVKKAAIERSGLAQPNLRIVPADLAETSLEAVLTSLGEARTNTPTVVLAEGLVMYLPKSAVTQLLQSIHATCGPQSRLVFSVVHADDRGRVVGIDRLTQVSLTLTGEPFRWTPSVAETPAFLAENGFEIIAGPAPEDLRRDYLQPLGLGETTPLAVERLWVARMNR